MLPISKYSPSPNTRGEDYLKGAAFEGYAMRHNFRVTLDGQFLMRPHGKHKWEMLSQIEGTKLNEVMPREVGLKALAKFRQWIKDKKGQMTLYKQYLSDSHPETAPALDMDEVKNLFGYGTH